MEPAHQLSAEQFDEQRLELPEAGRWTELIEGRTVILSPPGDAHGNIVRNLAKSLAIYAQETQRGYACFELGLIVSRDPDTVRFPAVCYFTQGERFAESDKFTTDVCPTLVIEIASSNDRRRNMEARIQSYLDWGVPLVWVIDPPELRVRTFEPLGESRTLTGGEVLRGDPAVPGLSQVVSALFEDPRWW